jgi:hypothetical protein
MLAARFVLKSQFFAPTSHIIITAVVLLGRRSNRAGRADIRDARCRAVFSEPPATAKVTSAS